MVNFADESVGVQYDEAVTGSEVFKKVLKQIGYTLVTDSEEAPEKADELRKARTFMWLAIGGALPVFVLAMFFMGQLPYSHFIEMAFTLFVLAVPGRRFYINAWKRARHLQANMDTLVALSTAIAFVYSAVNTLYPQWLTSRGLQADVYFESAAVIIAFVLIGKFLEERAKHQSGEAIRQLMALQPDEVTAVRNGEEVRISLKDVMEYDRLVIKASDRIPVDGKVIKGHSFVNESSVTGEPVPVEKQKGDALFAGTLNENGHMVMLAEKVGADTLLGRIIETVRNAQGSKAPAQLLADRIAGVFVPIVLLLSVLTFVLWWVLGGAHYLPQALVSAIFGIGDCLPLCVGISHAHRFDGRVG